MNADLRIVTADIGGTSVKIGASRGREICDILRRHPAAELERGDPVDLVSDWIADYLDETAISPDAVVVTVPGSVAADFDRVLRTANVPSLEGLHLRTGVQSRFRVPVILERDVHVLLRGEIVDHAIEERHVLGVFVGTGIGAAYISDGRILRGSGHAMQLGLAPIRGEGRSASWARPDAFEVYASGRAMSEFAAAEGFRIEDFFAEHARRPGVRTWFDRAFTDLVLHISTTVILLSPQVLVLGGGVFEMEGFPYDQLVSEIEGRLPVHDASDRLRIVRSRLGWRAAMLGGANLVQNMDDDAMRPVKGWPGKVVG